MCHLHLRVQLANDYIFLFKIHHFSQNPSLSNILCICIIIIIFYDPLQPPSPKSGGDRDSPIPPVDAYGIHVKYC